MSLELWSLTQSYLDLTFNYVALPVRRCIAQSTKATDVSPRGFTVLSIFLLYFYCLIIFKYIYNYDYLNYIILSILSKLPA